MTDTVTLIRCRSGFANVPDAFRVIASGVSPAINQFTEEADEYALPPGFSVGETALGELAIYDQGGAYCEIIQHRAGMPQLVGGDPHVWPTLAKVKA